VPPSGRPCLHASLVLALACAALIPRAQAETLTINSTPPGASLEIDGMAAGTTPYKVAYPAGYFRKPHTVFAARLDHSMTIKLSLDGYIVEHLTLTEGPFEWNSFNGRHHGSYFLLKSSQFAIHLDPVYHAGASSEAHSREGPLPPASALESRATENASPVAGGAVAIASDPSGADIYIDGNFMGQTPSTLRLAEGIHRIQLTSPGKQSWSRDLDVAKENQISLHPVLSSSP